MTPAPQLAVVGRNAINCEFHNKFLTLDCQNRSSCHIPTSTEDALTYYTEHGIISDPGRFARFFNNLPQDISQLCRIIQGLLLHAFWAERYGEKPSEERIACASIRHVEHIFKQIQEINSGPIEQSRPVFLYGQVGEKLTDCLLPHFQRMAFVVIEDKALGPVNVGLLGAVAIVH